MEGNIRYNIDRAREAQQQHEQKHDVQLELGPPVCKCGHRDYDHYPKGKGCVALTKDGSTFCSCSRFRPRAS